MNHGTSCRCEDTRFVIDLRLLLGGVRLFLDRKNGEMAHTQAGQAVIEPVTIIRGTNKG